MSSLTPLTGASSLIDVHWSLILSCVGHYTIARVRSVCKVINAASRLKTARPTMPLAGVFLDQITKDDTVASVESLLAQTMRGLPSSWEVDAIGIYGKAPPKEGMLPETDTEEMRKVDNQQTLIWMVMMNICAGIIEQRKLTATSTSPAAAAAAAAATTAKTFLSTASPDLIYLVDRFSQLRILHIYDMRVHILGYAFILEAFSPFLISLMLDQVSMSSFDAFVEMSEDNMKCGESEMKTRRQAILSSDPLVNPHFHDVITHITKTIWEIGTEPATYKQSRTSKLKHLLIQCTSVIHGVNADIQDLSILHLQVTRTIAYYSEHVQELQHTQYFANIHHSPILLNIMYFPSLRRLTLGYPGMIGILVQGLTFPSWSYLSTLQLERFEISQVSLDRNEWYSLLTGAGGAGASGEKEKQFHQVFEPMRKYFVEWETNSIMTDKRTTEQEKKEYCVHLPGLTVGHLLSHLSVSLTSLVIGLGSWLKSRDFGMLNYLESCNSLVIKEYNVRYSHFYNLMSAQLNGGSLCLSQLQVIRTIPPTPDGNFKNKKRAGCVADETEKLKVHAYLLHEWRQTHLVPHTLIEEGEADEAAKNGKPLPPGATHSVTVNWFDPTFTPPRVYFCCTKRAEDGATVYRYVRETQPDSCRYEIYLRPSEPTQEEKIAADGEPEPQDQQEDEGHGNDEGDDGENVPPSNAAQNFITNYMAEILGQVPHGTQQQQQQP